MAIVTMKKLTVVGMIKNRESLFDALIATQCIQLKQPREQEGCQVMLDSISYDKLLTQASRIEETINYITNTVSLYNIDYKKSSDYQPITIAKPSISRPLREVTYGQLSAMENIIKQLFAKIEKIENLRQEILSANANIANIKSQISRLNLYSKLPKPIDSYCDTDNTTVLLGTVPVANLELLRSYITDETMAELEIIDSDSDNAVIVLVAHKSETELLSNISSAGFARCNIKLDCMVSQHIASLNNQLADNQKIIDNNIKQVCQYSNMIGELKLASDYCDIELAKVTASGTMPTTNTTFVLEGYFPEVSQQVIINAIDSSCPNAVIYIDEIPREETAPIKYNNNKLVSNFEGVTNMYTPPAYHEIDPNPIMSIFYFIIFGLMVADMGYGLVLALIGLLGRILIKQKTGTRSLLTLFGICGLSAIGVGALYGSAFSYSVWTGVLPDAGVYPKTTMVICLLFGLVHMMAAFAMAGRKHAKNKEYVLAFGVSAMWVVFFAGLFMVLLQPALNFMDYQPFASVVLPDIVSTIGLILVGCSLVIILLCSGGSGKKGIVSRTMSAFGSLYGILNYFGDVMSYIRIFGLMLSSAMMGVVINDLGAMVAGGGGVVASILSVALLIFAHLFNLVIGVLGVYIHNGRLQYVEFFGKFYEGDGEMFAPFGSNTKYTLLVTTDNNRKTRTKSAQNNTVKAKTA